MNKWIVKPVEFDKDTMQLECPNCGDDMLYTHKDSKILPHYCPMCGVLLYKKED